MSKDVDIDTRPEYASEVPHVPMNWGNRDDITGRILQILEAVMPEGKQLEATKDLVKKSTKDYFIEAFNMQFSVLRHPVKGDGGESYDGYCEAIWREALRHRPTKDYN